MRETSSRDLENSPLVGGRYPATESAAVMTNRDIALLAPPPEYQTVPGFVNTGRNLNSAQHCDMNIAYHEIGNFQEIVYRIKINLWKYGANIKYL